MYRSQCNSCCWHVGSGLGSADPPPGWSKNGQLFPPWSCSAWSWDPAGSLVLRHSVRWCTADSSLLQPTLSKQTTHPLTHQNTQVLAQKSHHTPLHNPHSPPYKKKCAENRKVLPPSSSSVIPIIQETEHFSSRCFVKALRKLYGSC